MGNKIDLDKYSRTKKEKNEAQISFAEMAKLLAKKFTKKTGRALEYGTVTFVFHGGHCSFVEASPTFRIHEDYPDPPVTKVKFLRNR